MPAIMEAATTTPTTMLAEVAATLEPLDFSGVGDGLFCVCVEAAVAAADVTDVEELVFVLYEVAGGDELDLVLSVEDEGEEDESP